MLQARTPASSPSVLRRQHNAHAHIHARIKSSLLVSCEYVQQESMPLHCMVRRAMDVSPTHQHWFLRIACMTSLPSPRAACSISFRDIKSTSRIYIHILLHCRPRTTWVASQLRWTRKECLVPRNSGRVRVFVSVRVYQQPFCSCVVPVGERERERRGPGGRQEPGRQATACT